MHTDKANCSELAPLMTLLTPLLDEFKRFKHKDASHYQSQWRQQLNVPLSHEGESIEQVIQALGTLVNTGGSMIPKASCTSFITTGASNAAVLSQLAASVAAPQRIGATAFNYLEHLSLKWLKNLFNLPQHMQGIYSSGGSSANIIALGAARQQAYENIGIDPSEQGITTPGVIYATNSSHKTIQRAAAVLGLGRQCIRLIKTNSQGQICITDLRKHITLDKQKQRLAIAIVATAGTTSTGAIDNIQSIVEIAKQYGVWLHVDGAYGLPGILDPQISHRYKGIEHADSIIIDPHKWLGASVGIGATFVKNQSLLLRAFSQGESDYFEGSFNENNVQHSMQSMGTPYSNMGLELSAPSRGVVVWAILKELGKKGITERVCRHNAMATWLAKEVNDHPNLELALAPSLSICCFRYIDKNTSNLNDLNRQIHQQLLLNNRNLPSTAIINNKLFIRPCFIGARTEFKHAESLLEEVLAIGAAIEQTKYTSHLCKEAL